jgi:decaprenylphospho-beta-D-erythro-pentofuranosid-2-ulose 2-reductase
VSGSPVLILGAASDIGRAVARAYAASGRSLVLVSRQSERLARDAEDLRLRHGVEVRIAELDLLDTAAHRPFLDGLAETPGTVVLAVGLLGEQARSAADAGEAERVMRTTYLAPALLLGLIANDMERRGSGVIIGISSVAGDRGRAANYIYGSAKAGLTAYLSGLRNRLARKGVHVITVKPGFVDTRATQHMDLPALLTAQPDEVAAAILAAEEKRRDIVYVRRIWWPIMTIIRLLPEWLFKRLSI